MNEDKYGYFIMSYVPSAIVDTLLRQCAELIGVRSPVPGDRSHITLAWLGNFRSRLHDIATHVKAVFDAGTPPVSSVRLGRLVANGHAAQIETIESQTEVRGLQQDLVGRLTGAGMILPNKGFHPHITYGYRPDAKGRWRLDPVDWLVEDICLVESLQGKGIHNILGRWRLSDGTHGRQYSFDL